MPEQCCECAARLSSHSALWYGFPLCARCKALSVQFGRLPVGASDEMTRRFDADRERFHAKKWLKVDA